MHAHLIIYGVFQNDRCVMVGSTQNSLKHRARQYRRFKWFNPERHKHIILWSGILEAEDSEQLRFWRAVKEAAMIGFMRTWYSQGGRNQTNPVVQAVGMPFGYCDVGKTYGRFGGLVGGRKTVESGTLHKLTKEECRKGNAALSYEMRAKGGIRCHEMHPALAAEHGRIYGRRNAENGTLARASHTRWHINRGVINRECLLCQLS